MQEDWRAGGFGIYLHWPFCQSKCPYCDFNSHVAARIDQTEWQRAYLSEIDRLAEEAGDRLVNSVFFGGGTPSLMQADVVGAILDRISSHWPIANDVEVTLEANPGSVDAARFAGYRAAGVNRLSMGVQALNDADLRRLGRLHSVSEAKAAFDIARRSFDRVSFDLIYARQDQTLGEWEGELVEALSMAVDHLSLYQLTIEEGTAFGDRFAKGGLKGLPDEDLSADMYDLTQDICEAHGMPAYEVSNHARPGSESLHNSVYWRCGDFLGIGPGAHGRLTTPLGRRATESHRSPALWLSAVSNNGSGESSREVLSHKEMAEECLVMSMRLVEGMDRKRFEVLAGREIGASLLETLEGEGLIGPCSERVAATQKGRRVLNHLIREIARCI